jgi:hypothetical protein
MAIRLIVTITAAPGKGSELAQGYRTRRAEIMKEPGCEQFEVFQSVVNLTSWRCWSAGPTRRLWTCTQNLIALVLRCRRSCVWVKLNARTTSTTGPANQI